MYARPLALDVPVGHNEELLVRQATAVLLAESTSHSPFRDEG